MDRELWDTKEECEAQARYAKLSEADLELWNIFQRLGTPYKAALLQRTNDSITKNGKLRDWYSRVNPSPGYLTEDGRRDWNKLHQCSVMAIQFLRDNNFLRDPYKLPNAEDERIPMEKGMAIRYCPKECDPHQDLQKGITYICSGPNSLQLTEYTHLNYRPLAIHVEMPVCLVTLLAHMRITSFYMEDPCLSNETQ